MALRSRRNFTISVSIFSVCTLMVFLFMNCGTGTSTTGNGSTNTANVSDGTGTQIAVSSVSGAINNTSGSQVAVNDFLNTFAEKNAGSFFQRFSDLVFEPSACAASWTCTPATGSYSSGTLTYTPPNCSITWANGKSANSTWAGSGFAVTYSGCLDGSATYGIAGQPANCAITRRTDASGMTRTLTGPAGNSYSVKHDTNGSGSGYDSSIAATSGGLVVSCGVSGCNTGHTVVINGSHLTGTVDGALWWDHTVTTSGSGVTITGSGTSRVANGTVVVQHNRAKFTSTTTFSGVGYGRAGCCFPTTGSVTTTFSGGSLDGKSETLAFTAICGETNLTASDGTSTTMTLTQCI